MVIRNHSLYARTCTIFKLRCTYYENTNEHYYVFLNFFLFFEYGFLCALLLTWGHGVTGWGKRYITESDSRHFGDRAFKSYRVIFLVLVYH